MDSQTVVASSNSPAHRSYQQSSGVGTRKYDVLKENSQSTRNFGPSICSRSDDLLSTAPLLKTLRRQTLAGCTSSVDVVQFEPLRSIPSRRPSARRTSSVDVAQFEPLHRKAIEQTDAGSTSAVDDSSEAGRDRHLNAGCIVECCGGRDRHVPPYSQYSNPRPSS